MILILAATPLETKLLRQHISDQQVTQCASNHVIGGCLCHQDILLAHSGIGLVNMAILTSQILNQYKPDIVFLVGCGGSYPNSGLSNGDLVLADCEIYGDLGVETDDDFLLLSGIASNSKEIKVRDVQQKITFNKNLINLIVESIPQITVGPFVSVNCCSGTPELSQKLEQRTKGLCENMEGAAAAQLCAEANIPMIELRGISNPTGTRDPEQWDLLKGTECAQNGLLKLLETWPPNREILCKS
jgi:futalosine hydrolase